MIIESIFATICGVLRGIIKLEDINSDSVFICAPQWLYGRCRKSFNATLESQTTLWNPEYVRAAVIPEVDASLLDTTVRSILTHVYTIKPRRYYSGSVNKHTATLATLWRCDDRVLTVVGYMPKLNIKLAITADMSNKDDASRHIDQPICWLTTKQPLINGLVVTSKSRHDPAIVGLACNYTTADYPLENPVITSCCLYRPSRRHADYALHVAGWPYTITAYKNAIPPQLVERLEALDHKTK